MKTITYDPTAPDVYGLMVYEHMRQAIKQAQELKDDEPVQVDFVLNGISLRAFSTSEPRDISLQYYLKCELAKKS